MSEILHCQSYIPALPYILPAQKISNLLPDSSIAFLCVTLRPLR